MGCVIPSKDKVAMKKLLSKTLIPLWILIAINAAVIIAIWVNIGTLVDTVIVIGAALAVFDVIYLLDWRT